MHRGNEKSRFVGTEFPSVAGTNLVIRMTEDLVSELIADICCSEHLPERVAKRIEDQLGIVGDMLVDVTVQVLRPSRRRALLGAG